MTRPDSNSPDPDSSDSRANQDDAVWLDLVARLEGRDPGASPGTPDVPGAKDSGDEAERPEAPVTDGGRRRSTARQRRPAAPRPFSDFDPLGLSAGAPIELSAEERLAQSQAAGGAQARRPARRGWSRGCPGAAGL